MRKIHIHGCDHVNSASFIYSFISARHGEKIPIYSHARQKHVLLYTNQTRLLLFATYLLHGLWM